MSDFDSIVEGLELEPPPESDVDYSLLDDLPLTQTYNKVRGELLELGEMLNPSSERGRELHSQRTALVVELRKRNLLG